MKSVNLATVKFSPKWFGYAVLAFIVVIAAWGIAQWVFGKFAGLTSKATEKVTGGGGGW